MDWIARLPVGDDETEIDVFCTGEYHPATRGYRNSMGVPEEPDESASIEVLSAVIYDNPREKGRDILKDLSEEQVVSLEEQGLESIDEYGL